MVLLVTLTLAVLSGQDRIAFAGQGEVSLEGFGGGGVGPEDGSFGVNFNSAIGGGAGIAYEVVENLQLEMDVAYYRWGKAGGGSVTAWTCNTLIGIDCGATSGTVDEKLSDTPIFLGGRYLFHLNNMISPFLELGLTANILEAKFDGELLCNSCPRVAICCPGPPPPVTQTSETTRALRFGVAPGFGVKFVLTRHVDLGVAFRYNVVDDGVGNAHNLHPSFVTFSLFTVCFRQGCASGRWTECLPSREG